MAFQLRMVMLAPHVDSLATDVHGAGDSSGEVTSLIRITAVNSA